MTDRRAAFQSFLVAIGALRAPVIVSLLGALVLLLPAQSHEIFHAMAEEKGLLSVLELGRALAVALLIAILIGACGLVLLRSAPPYRKDAIERHKRLIYSIAMAAPLGLLFSMALAALDPFGAVVAKGRSLLVLTAFWVAAVGLLASFDGIRDRLIDRWAAMAVPFQRLGLWWGLISVCAIIAGLIAIVVCLPRPFALVLGPLQVVMLFAGALAIAASLLGFIYDRHGVPVIALSVCGAMLWAYLPTNNNHQIRFEKVAEQPPDAAKAFEEWLLNRPDLDAYISKGRPYPVYLVTAEGGGLYAAAHAAWRLARIQDACPTFARHVFAISSVSGGSLGAALFAALVKADSLVKEAEKKPEQIEVCTFNARADGPMQQAVREYFKEDFLTPLIAAGLFPDFFQSFWPWPIEAFDRARALEDSFATAWQRVAPKGNEMAQQIFDRTHRELWSHREDQPALLINSTVVHSGERVVMAPFRLWKPPPLIFVDGTVDFFNEQYGIPLKVAASISARFPIVTPPAMHKHKVAVGASTIETVLQIVDGGYYENSGVFTAMNLIDRIRSAPISRATSESGRSCEANNLIALPRRADQTPISACVKLIIIRELSQLRGEFPTGDLTSAIVAMYKVRFAKAAANLGLAGQLYCGGVNCGLGKWAVRPHVYGAYIDVQKLGLPLGWYFSDKAMSKVFETDPTALECPIAKDVSEARPADTPEAAREEESACLRSRISQDLLPPRGG